MKALKGTWLIQDSYTDKETGFLLTETTRFYGFLSEAIENTITHFTTQDLRYQYYSDKDLTKE